MKQYLLPEKGKFYKANLHMHSTISDGNETPEEIKKSYMAHGYSIVAYTDHEVLLSHNELADENFLPITSYEINIAKPDSEKCYHFNLFAKDKNNTVSRAFDAGYVWGISKQYIPENAKSFGHERKYDIDTVNEFIRMSNEDGFLVSYNHPVWSTQDYTDYIGLKGVWGIEVINYSAVVVGNIDTITPVDDLARAGEPVVPLGTDDAHHNFDRYGGFVMIKADKLEYDTILKAMEKGDLYASGGPEIKELYIEDEVVHIETSAAANIMLTTHGRHAELRKSDKPGELITSADFNVHHILKHGYDDYFEGKPPYFRLTVTGPDGLAAYSRPYYVKEILK